MLEKKVKEAIEARIIALYPQLCPAKATERQVTIGIYRRQFTKETASEEDTIRIVGRCKAQMAVRIDLADDGEADLTELFIDLLDNPYIEVVLGEDETINVDLSLSDADTNFGDHILEEELHLTAAWDLIKKLPEAPAITIVDAEQEGEVTRVYEPIIEDEA